MKNNIFKADEQGITQAREIICGGGIIAFPTETYYGLGADAFDRHALQRLFRVKSRKANKPLLLLIAQRTWLPNLVKKIPSLAEKLMGHFWPGPLTLIFEASENLPEILTAGTGKVGIRISSHPIAKALVEAVGGPITGTSANRSGEASLRDPDQVRVSLGDSVDGVLDGGITPGGTGSTVLDVTGEWPYLIRAGSIATNKLFSVIATP